jgi:hypothetical protein
MRRKILPIAAVTIILLAVCFSVHPDSAPKITKVHTLKFPMLLGGPGGNGPFQFLPKGATLYYDESYPEGFTKI